MRMWAFWRRSVYVGFLLVVLAIFGGNTYLKNFYTPPNCFDQKANGSERGVDCGGDCVRICAIDVMPPKVVWVNSFKINEGQYNSVAYVENPNQSAGSQEVKYVFTLKNGEQTVAERSGTTILPPNSVYPIFEGRIFTDEGSPITNTFIEIEPPEIWQLATVGSEQFRTRDIELTNGDVNPRLDVTLENTTIETASDVEVVATIFNANGQPVTASQTVVDLFPAESTEDIVFTWPNSIAKTVRSCIIPNDIVMILDLSGSMDVDNEDPPQPLTDALEAASSFARDVGEEDQLSLVTLASEARLQKFLNKDFFGTATQIKGLTIGTEEQSGFTNTRAALEIANTELNSTRHNPDARRVVITLTDGLPTDEDDEFPVVEQATSLAKEMDLSGVEMYAIGLGTEVDLEFIRKLSSSNEQAYFAPDSQDLEADLKDIYDSISNSICEVGPTKIDIIAKSKASFVPLR